MLLPHHAELIRASAISREVAEDRGYYSLPEGTALTELMKLGFAPDQAKRTPALVIPVWNAAGEISTHQIRPDHPHVDRRGKTRKYEFPRGAEMVIDVPPAALPRLRDPEHALWVSEGSRKADAAVTAGLCCIDLLGVWNWRGTNEAGGKTVLPDWDLIALEGRTVFICFDSDVVRKEQVRAAIDRLVGFLRLKKAKPLIVHLPDSGQREKTGLDDYLADGGKVEELIKGATEPVAATEEEKSFDDSPARIGDEILDREHFARDAGERLYVFYNGVYDPRGEAAVKFRVKRFYTHRKKKWKITRAGEVAAWIAADRPYLWDRPPTDQINLLNGILELETGALKPHDPKQLSSVQLPVRFDPRATCPTWETFVSEVFPEDAQELAWELAAWLMVPNTWLQKAVLLIGEGGNGKSTFLAALKTFLGDRNVSATSLHRLELDRFAPAELVGKLANICPDLPSEHLSGTSVFKAATGGDAITAERKYGNTFTFQPYARFVFSCNRPPQSNDPSEGFFARWLVLPFERAFRGTDEEIPRRVLDARLAEPGELSGVLNRAVAVWRRVQDRGLTVYDSMRAAHRVFHDTTDPVTTWLDDHLVEHPAAMIPKKDLQREYNRHAAEEGKWRENNTSFSMAIKRWRPNLRTVHRVWKGKATWCWLGVGLISDPGPDVPSEASDPSPSSESPYPY